MSVRTFDGTDDFIRCTGTAGQIGNGPFTMVALVRPTSVPGADENYFGFSNGTATSMANLYADNGNSGANLGWGGNVSDSVGNAAMTEDVWQVIAASKPNGTSVARFHRKVLGSGSWTHVNGTGNTVNDTTNVTDAWFGKFPNGSGIRDCDIAVCAAFSAELSDADIEGIESAASTQELLDLGAIHVWELNQPNTSIPLLDKVGGLHQSSITGTSVTEGADPAWTYLDADGTPDFPYIVSEGALAIVTTGTLSPTIPTHQADDILVCTVNVWVPNTAGSAAVIPTPANWTKQGSVQFPGTPDGECALFWMRATGSGTTVTFTRGASWDTGTDGQYSARAYVIRGCATTGDPWDEFDPTAALTAANGSVDALTVSGSNRTAIQFLSKTDDFVTAPTVSGWTAGTQVESTTGTDSSFGAFFKYGISSSTSADASTVEAPAAGAYVFFGASFKPPAAGLAFPFKPALRRRLHRNNR